MSNNKLFEGRTCECCGKSEFLKGVASSGLGPFSILWCDLCLKMQAEPKWAIDCIYETNDWRTKQANADDFIYFSEKFDNYVAYGSGAIVRLKLKDGTEFATRSECVEYLLKKGKKDGR